MIRFLEVAQKELDEAVVFHEEQVSGLGKAFLAEVLAALRLVRRYPAAWHRLSANTRRCRLRRFPCGLIYHEDGSDILIVAVAHLHRHPEYWRDRLPSLAQAPAKETEVGAKNGERQVVSEDGFTFMEFVVVIFLIAILAGYAVLRWPTLDRPQPAALQLAAHLRLTQSLAISRGGNWRLVVVSPGSYQIRDPDNLVYAAYALPASSWGSTSAAEIRFDATGAPVVGAGNYVVEKSGESMTVQVVDKTGTAVVLP
ncbi:MAG: type II toxin-antitoxin system RelE/ParE family toxin [Magnetococcales bacterium]|nr:type II toxin-antitoxin system RelE/ParE family toxin [Magnetococcales bacterium]NGZ27828.1 type II toxin-antitoxin system RelE/ParE family toxin [Magnetococcales bacterium]